MNEITECQSQFKTQKKYRTIWNIRDHVPMIRKPQYASYDNKPLSKWDSDDFAGFVIDQCDSKMKLQLKSDSFLNEIDMLNYIPENYARVYLYGVWECIKPVLKYYKLNPDK